jgi:hypothetical protein
MEAHVDCLRSLLLDAVRCDADGQCVVAHYDCGVLRIAHVGKCGPNGCGVLSGGE